jgi:hypothetical protein
LFEGKKERAQQHWNCPGESNRMPLDGTAEREIVKAQTMRASQAPTGRVL